ncbi:MAG: ferrous iron transport protein B, partial [candidate division WOR-3 bacterium]|nr:ferrous iron transport protein B [candidate division WOR-3 bacterium]
SLTAYSLDEKVAHNYLVQERPDTVVAVVDAANIERNLYLVVQLLELGAKVILDLNMVDVAKSQGVVVDAIALEKALGVKVVTTVANKSEGLDDLKRLIHDIGRMELRPRLRVDYGEDVETEVDALTDAVWTCPADGPPVRWLALRLLEGDTDELHHFDAEPCSAAVHETLARSTARLRQRLGGDIESHIIRQRFAFVRGLVRECVRQPAGPVQTVSDRIDRVVIHPWLGIPLFLLLMGLAFMLVFRLGAPLSGLIDAGFTRLGTGLVAALTAVHAPEWVGSLLADGLVGGIGSVLVFVPNIALLFLAISVLEDSGYMARAAFVMDRLMHAMGLHGKSFIPLIMGFGCCVPAVLATRSLDSRKDRLLTIMIVPLMSCSARLPIYTLFAAAFFPRRQWLVVLSLYVLGIVLAIIVARVLRSLLFKGETTPLIMELPPYHAPVLKHLLRSTGRRTWFFVRKAGTVIAAAVVLLWILARLPWGADYASQQTLIGRIGTLLAPVFAPAGFGFWQAAVALVAGIVAKELVVSTLGTLAGTGGPGLAAALHAHFTPLSAYAFMAMSLIYIPCVATIAAVRRETNWGWAGLTTGYSLILGWAVAVAVYQVGRLLGA